MSIRATSGLVFAWASIAADACLSNIVLCQLGALPAHVHIPDPPKGCLHVAAAWRYLLPELQPRHRRSILGTQPGNIFHRGPKYTHGYI